MAPFVLFGTVGAHLFGASVGREGSAIQMSASLADNTAHLLRLRGVTRRELLVASLAGGFGAVFGVPVAGAVFALEVQSVGRVKFEAVLASFTAAFVGDAIVGGLGHEHSHRGPVAFDGNVWTTVRVALAGIAFGLAAALFVWLTHRIKSLLGRLGYPPARAAIAGGLVVAGSLVLGDQYLSLSLPMAAVALSGAAVAPLAWLGKIVFTATCLGAGIPGGEVTPLFVIGSLLGAALAGPLGVSAPLLAAVGFVAVFGAAANTPIACTMLFVELFGSAALLPAAMACAVAYLASSHRGIYPSQRVEVPKRYGAGGGLGQPNSP
ncbi:MAG: chloride channel protein [Ilumatobacteraceae bacterium]